MNFDKSKALKQKSHDLIPGGAHTYAKGDDQYPELAPGFLERGKGCHVWDMYGNEFIEYGMGLRSVTLGHTYEPVVEVASRQMRLGINFNRPSSIEVECAEMLVDLIIGAEMAKFAKNGYDERQYSSPGFNLAVGNLSCTPHGRFPEYHTSADNLEFVKPASLADSFSKYAEIINVVDNNKKYLNTNPKGKPQLGKRGLYSTMGGSKDASNYEMALLWILNLSDGKNSLLDIAERSGIKFSSIQEAAKALFDCGLLVEAERVS